MVSSSSVGCVCLNYMDVSVGVSVSVSVGAVQANGSLCLFVV